MSQPLIVSSPIPWLAIAFFVFAGIVALFMAWLLVDWLWSKVERAREQRDMRIRDAQLKRYNIVAFRGSKDRFL